MTNGRTRSRSTELKQFQLDGLFNAHLPWSSRGLTLSSIAHTGERLVTAVQQDEYDERAPHDAHGSPTTGADQPPRQAPCRSPSPEWDLVANAAMLQTLALHRRWNTRRRHNDSGPLSAGGSTSRVHSLDVRPDPQAQDEATARPESVPRDPLPTLRPQASPRAPTRDPSSGRPGIDEPCGRRQGGRGTPGNIYWLAQDGDGAASMKAVMPLRRDIRVVIVASKDGSLHDAERRGGGSPCTFARALAAELHRFAASSNGSTHGWRRWKVESGQRPACVLGAVRTRVASILDSHGPGRAAAGDGGCRYCETVVPARTGRRRRGWEYSAVAARGRSRVSIR